MSHLPDPAFEIVPAILGDFVKAVEIAKSLQTVEASSKPLSQIITTEFLTVYKDGMSEPI